MDGGGRVPHRVARGAGRRLAQGGIAGRGRLGRALRPARKAEPVNLSDHRITRDIAELGSDLAGTQPIAPELLEQLDAFVGPCSGFVHRITCLSGRPRGVCLEGRFVKEIRDRRLLYRKDKTVAAATKTVQETPHEMSYLTKETIQAAVTREQEVAESKAAFPQPIGN